jgi:predicted glycoside hydrolase/deacetylase ChbG (UPF0249 family)
MRKTIVNADDFGMSAEVNRAIVEAFENNVISSTTLMANMPGFDEACELARRHRLVIKIGLHLNLTSGFPIIISQFEDAPGFANQWDVSRSVNSVQVVKGREARSRWVEKLLICNGPVV